MAKLVQGERSAKEKLKDFHFALPSRSLTHQKIVEYGMSRSPKRQKPPRIQRRKEATVHWESRHLACFNDNSRQDACSPSAPSPPLTSNNPRFVMGLSISRAKPDAEFTAFP